MFHSFLKYGEKAECGAYIKPSVYSLCTLYDRRCVRQVRFENVVKYQINFQMVLVMPEGSKILLFPFLLFLVSK